MGPTTGVMDVWYFNASIAISVAPTACQWSNYMPPSARWRWILSVPVHPINRTGALPVIMSITSPRETYDYLRNLGVPGRT